LGKLFELHRLEEECDELKGQLAEVDRELNRMTVNKDKFQELKQRVDLKEQEISLLNQRIQRTPFFQLQEKVL
jgi:hypothetical protein